MDLIRNTLARYLHRFAPAALLLVTVVSFTSPFAAQIRADENREAGLVVPAELLEAQQQRAAIMQRAADATVAIFGLDGGGGGSGVVVTRDGYALTNYHVSSACGDHMRCGMNDGKVYDAVIVGIDATGDLSLIKLFGRDDFPTAPLADSSQVRVGQWCFAAGNPFVLATNLQPSISLGIVSGVNRYQYPAGTLLEYADCIQTDAAINPGNSGGPLFNMSAEVIGINGRCSFEKRGRINVGVGYAISANQVKYFMGVLSSGRLVDHATLGATVSTEDSGKVKISNILSSSDAYRRGLRYGDEVVRFADREVRTTNMFKNILGTLPKNWRVPMEIRRNGTSKTLLVRLEGVHTEKQLIDLVSGELIPGSQPPSEPDKKDTPGDKEDKSDTEKPDKSKQRIVPERFIPLQPAKELIASKLESRSGFANYHFNRVKRKTIWSRIQSLGPLDKLNTDWTLTGTLATEPTKISIKVNRTQGELSVGSRTLEVGFEDAISEIVTQRRETGLLVALRALQDFLTKGPEEIGDTLYLGTAPVYAKASTVLNEQPLCDVLQSLWYDAQVRFSVPQESNRIRLIEVFGDAGTDPVELYLDKYAKFDIGGASSILLPSVVRLQYGTTPMLLLKLDAASVSTPRKSVPPVDAEVTSIEDEGEQP